MTKGELRFEEFPLQAGSHYQSDTRQFLKGPSRVARLCFLGIFVPSLLLSVPLYLRYRVYSHQLYPLSISDMRMLDNRMSTTWCQRQKIRVNATFNAFLLPNVPELSNEKKRLSMARELILEDDTKEYWGFYLLKGTSVTVSTCVRWPGASLIVIRGHKHLHECAYIGDNSSEELEELMKEIKEENYMENIDSTERAIVNQPELMRRHRPDVEFHNATHKNKTRSHHTLDRNIDIAEITDPIAMKNILEALYRKKNAKGKLLSKMMRPDEAHNSTTKQPVQLINSQEVVSDILDKLRRLGDRGSKILQRVNEKYKEDKIKEINYFNTKSRKNTGSIIHFNDNIDVEERRKRELIQSTAEEFNREDEDNNVAIEEGLNPDGIAQHWGIINETAPNDMSNSEYWSSFSSSEETLLNCAGLVLNLPLTPHHLCYSGLDDKDSYKDNTITYKVPTNGYYFFVFNSENEIQPNYIRARFDLEKSVYNVSNPVASCVNRTDSCSLDLNFFSTEKLVMELPLDENSNMWNEEMVVMSECEPRTMIYAICVITVPVMIMLFAFT